MLLQQRPKLMEKQKAHLPGLQMCSSFHKILSVTSGADVEVMAKKASQDAHVLCTFQVTFHECDLKS
jgi:hypothetical protein